MTREIVVPHWQIIAYSLLETKKMVLTLYVPKLITRKNGKKQVVNASEIWVFYPFSHFPFLKIYLSGGLSEYFDRPKERSASGETGFYCYFWVSGQDNGHVTFLYSFERHESWSPRHGVHDSTMRAASLLLFWDPTNLAFAERLHYLLLSLPSSCCTFVGLPDTLCCPERLRVAKACWDIEDRL